jgi:Fur family transcriptional regulator, ferric uptake regulator
MASSLRSTLHGRGKRMTTQRQLVLDAVRELEHATPEKICGHIQQTAPAVNITTVYRTLELLSELGLVRHIHIGHGAPVYSAEDHEHLHLVCHRCGGVVEAPRDLLDEVAMAARSRWGFELDAAHVALSGMCSACIGSETAQ